MTTPPFVSVIIPTYNRKKFLRETLDTLVRQTYPSDRFEVIIVDDGSTDDTATIAAERFPFPLRYFWQSNQGDAEARNLGARQSQAEILVFLDDDILVEPDYLAQLIQAYEVDDNGIVIGTWNLWPAETTSFARSLFGEVSTDPIAQDAPAVLELPFSDAYSNNMSIRREAYFKIGMMQGLDFPGSSMWCDLDFNYRADKQGFRFFRSTKALCWHRDHTVRNLDTYKKRMRTASYRSIALFKRYPELLHHVPMFQDKPPISWSKDRPWLIVRKFGRALASSRLVLWSMEQGVHILEKYQPSSTLLPTLYRYIVGGYVFQGYREGLKELGRANHLGDPDKVTMIG
jgi:glycosyltransferase involved in cell wall biosynthesis